MTTQGGELSEERAGSGGADQMRHTDIFAGWPSVMDAVMA